MRIKFYFNFENTKPSTRDTILYQLWGKVVAESEKYFEVVMEAEGLKWPIFGFEGLTWHVQKCDVIEVIE